MSNKSNKCIYQSDLFRKSLEISGKKIVIVSENFFATENFITLPLLGKKKILEARGTPSEEEAEKFKVIAKDYSYGTISPTVVKKNWDVLDKAGFKKVSNSTILIDLSKTEEELWNGLEKKSTRWGAKSAEKNGLKFELASEEDLGKFYEMYKKTGEEGGFDIETKEAIVVLRDSEISKLFVVKKEDKILAGGLILLDKENKYSILDLTSSSEEGLKMQAMPFLYWNFIKYSKVIGLRYFDLGGYDSEAKEGEKTYNINKYKERFSGEIVEQPIYSSNWKYSFMRSVLRKFRFLKGVYKKNG